MVIQRWQSLLLLIASIMMGLFTFCSLGQISTTDFTFNYNSMGFSYLGEATEGAPTGVYETTWYFFTLSLTTTLILLIDIFLYVNLPLQKKVAVIGILFIVACSIIGFALGYNAIPEGSIQWSPIRICPLIALVATLFALNRIQSDHNKLRSADRIR